MDETELPEQIDTHDLVDVADRVLGDQVVVNHDHQYECVSATCRERGERSQATLQFLNTKVQELEQELRQLQVSRKSLTVDDIKDDDEKMLLYTSVPYDIFVILQKTLERFKLNYYRGWTVTGVKLPEQLLLTLMKLRLGAKDLDLAQRFGISRSTVSNIFTTLICALHELLYTGMLRIPSQRKCQGSLPQSFEQFVTARAVIDATEITQDIPSGLNEQSSCYSNYKSRHTVKAVTAVAPNAAIVYSTDLYPGSVSDVAIMKHSKLLSNFVPGDLILADKGFTIFDQLPRGVSLNIPPFLRERSYFTKQESDLCLNIAKARIHVERANERIKNFDILNHVPAHLRPLSTKIFQVCCCLVNLQAPLIKEIADKYNFDQ